MKQKKINILVFITHSLSEINVLYPLFAELSKEGGFKISVVFTVRKIYGQYMKDEYYRYCEDRLGIKTYMCHLPNKFDKNLDKLYLLPFGNGMRKYFITLWTYFKLPNLITKLILSDIYMHEFSDRRESTRLLYLGQVLMRKRILTYHHGSEISIDKTASPCKNNSGKRTILIFHHHNSMYMKKKGYSRQAVIGYPIFFPEWKKIVNEYPGGEFSRRSIILIYSRHVVERYMDPEKYDFLLRSTLRVLRKKFGNIPIVIKPHPREDIRLINEIVKKQEISDVKISFEHPAVLAKNARIAIAFWGSVVLESLSMEVPTVEYYIEARRFREDYPSGSNYKAVGIHAVSNEQELEDFVNSVLKKNYKFPTILDEFNRGKDIQIFKKPIVE
mgnify:CR=1 FL=1